MNRQGFLLCAGLLAYWLKMTYNERPGVSGGAAAAEGRIGDDFPSLRSCAWVVCLGSCVLGRVYDEY